MPNLNLLIIDSNSKISDALKLINKNGRGICFVVDSKKLIGIATDGDIRRFLLKANDIRLPIRNAMNKKFISLHVSASQKEIRASFKNGIKIIPLHDDEFNIVDIADVQKSHRIQVLEPQLKGNELDYVIDCIKTNWISSQGKYVSRFEEMFSNLHEERSSLAVSSGTTALHLALMALDIGVGDEVIIPNVTFAACANAVIHCGASPVLCEIDPKTWCLDIKETEKLINKRTKAIMLVHLYGQLGNPAAFAELARRHNIYLIEDCAEALGSSYHNKNVGTFGDIGTFSFFGNKTISTGEGGMLIYKNKDVFSKSKILRDHGMSPSKRYWHEIVGYNYRLTNLQAAIGVAQLERFDEILKKKRKISELYKNKLSKIDHISALPHHINNTIHSNWLFTIILDEIIDRDKIILQLLNLGIETRPVFYSLNTMPPFKNFNQSKFFKNSKILSQQGLSLPSSTSLQEEEISYICNSLIELLK